MLNTIKNAILKSNLKSLHRQAVKQNTKLGINVSKGLIKKHECDYLNDTYMYYVLEDGKENQKPNKNSIHVNQFGDVFFEEIHLDDYTLIEVDNTFMKQYRVSVYNVKSISL